MLPQKNPRAIVTLALGEQFVGKFRRWFLPGWERYCQIHHLDLIVVEAPMDLSERAAQRSPSWQKCLIHRLPGIDEYEQIAWVDSDIRIRGDAPNISEDPA